MLTNPVSKTSTTAGLSKEGKRQVGGREGGWPFFGLAPCSPAATPVCETSMPCNAASAGQPQLRVPGCAGLQVFASTYRQLRELGLDSAAWFWPSITQNAYQTAEILVRPLSEQWSAHAQPAMPGCLAAAYTQADAHRAQAAQGGTSFEPLRPCGPLWRWLLRLSRGTAAGRPAKRPCSRPHGRARCLALVAAASSQSSAFWMPGGWGSWSGCR